jgi:hypothetical protein
MATIRVKRGTTKPTTASLPYVGELAFDYTNNALYARNSTAVVKVGGELEKVYSYEGASSSHTVTYTFDPSYLYKIHIVASTQGTLVDASATYFNYRNASITNLSGSYNAIYSNDASTTITKISARNTTNFMVQDVHSSGTTLMSGITKVIDFELSPTFSASLADTQQWVAYGKGITTVTGQADATITMVDFVHSMFGSIAYLFIYPGLNIGNPDLISVTIYRTLRK